MPSVGAVGTPLAGSSASSANIPVPPGTAAGEIVLVFIYKENTASISTVPSGFTLLATAPTTTSNVVQHSVYWKRCTGTDSGTYNFSWSVFNSTYRSGVAVRIHDAIESGNPFDGVNTNFVNSSVTATPNVAITTTGANRLLLWSGANWNGGSWTPPGTFTEIFDNTGNMSIASKIQPTAGASGNVSGTCSSAQRSTAWLIGIYGRDIRYGNATAPISLGATTTGQKRAVSSRTATAMALGASSSVQKRISSTRSATALSLTAGATSGRLRSTAETASPLTLGASNRTRFVIPTSASPITLGATRTSNKIGVGHPSTSPVSLDGYSSNTFKRGIGHPTPNMHFTAEAINPLRTGGDPIPVTIPKLPPLTQPVRVIAQNILTKQWVDWDLPVSDLQISEVLSGPQVIKGYFAPEVKSIRELGLDAWTHYLHVEIDGQIRASGIFMPPGYDDEKLTFEAIGVSGYATGIPYLGAEYGGILVDPMEMVRKLWAHVQSFPEGNLGLILDNTLSGKQIGDPPKLKMGMEEDGITQKIVETKTRGDVPGSKDNYQEVVKGQVSDAVWNKLLTYGYTAWPTKYSDAIKIFCTNYDYNRAIGVPAAPDTEEGEVTTTAPAWSLEEQKPYTLLWWDLVDCGREVDTLAKATPFDYWEENSWNADKTDVVHRLRLGYPRKGTKRLDLRFAQDENILDAVAVQEGDTTFASAVIVVGAGEGRDAIRGYAGERYEKRLRRVAFSNNKIIKDQTKANALAIDELLSRRGRMMEIAEITIDAQHPNARFGEYQTGDDILVQVDVPWIGQVSVWHRITSITYRADRDLATLALKRSDSFRYGSTIE